MQNPDPYLQLEEKIVRWAETQTAVYAVLRIGSRARQVGPADEWSDLDLILLAAAPEQYAQDAAWLEVIGEPLIPVLERHESGFEWLVLFADGLKADFYFSPADEDVTAVLARFPYSHVLQRGTDVLYVQPGLALDLPPGAPPPVTLPTAVALQHEVNTMLLSGFKAARFIRRGDLWRAHLLLDTTMRSQLLTMIEWHAWAQFGPELDTWYNGRYLEDWADARAVAALPFTYAGYTAADSWRALLAMLTLYRWLAEETAVRCQLPFSPRAADQVLAWIQEIYLTNSSTGI
ncbi:MAG: aminoglycoside 6-adenylyltransferase [Ardenticatenaceae bacterium]|nr:aminoglycoside 6-adenylyltransferase [Ardenticatenaceae bacterium]